MKSIAIAFSLVFSFTTMAADTLEYSIESATKTCAPNEELERYVMARVCMMRDIQTGVCMYWENLYAERCVPKKN